MMAFYITFVQSCKYFLNHLPIRQNRPIYNLKISVLLNVGNCKSPIPIDAKLTIPQQKSLLRQCRRRLLGSYFEFTFQMRGFKLSVLKAFSACLSISPQRKHSHKSSPSRNILAWHFEHIATSRSMNTTGFTAGIAGFARRIGLSPFTFTLRRCLLSNIYYSSSFFFFGADGHSS
jgi:hypothetical protein